MSIAKRRCNNKFNYFCLLQWTIPNLLNFEISAANVSIYWERHRIENFTTTWFITNLNKTSNMKIVKIISLPAKRQVPARYTHMRWKIVNFQNNGTDEMKWSKSGCHRNVIWRYNHRSDCFATFFNVFYYFKSIRSRFKKTKTFSKIKRSNKSKYYFEQIVNGFSNNKNIIIYKNPILAQRRFGVIF